MQTPNIHLCRPLWSSCYPSFILSISLQCLMPGMSAPNYRLKLRQSSKHSTLSFEVSDATTAAVLRSPLVSSKLLSGYHRLVTILWSKETVLIYHNGNSCVLWGGGESTVPRDGIKREIFLRYWLNFWKNYQSHFPLLRFSCLATDWVRPKVWCRISFGLIWDFCHWCSSRPVPSANCGKKPPLTTPEMSLNSWDTACWTHTPTI